MAPRSLEADDRYPVCRQIMEQELRVSRLNEHLKDAALNHVSLQLLAACLIERSKRMSLSTKCVSRSSSQILVHAC